MNMIFKKHVIKYIIISIILGISFNSCNKENGPEVLRMYFPKDKEIVFSEYIIVENDTVLDGKYTVCKYNGEKIKSGIYKNGKSLDAIDYYFDNNNSENKRELDLEAVFDYKKEKIKRYMMYDDFGKSAFFIKFDKQGHMESYKGFPIMEIYQYKIVNKKQFKTKNNQYLKVGDILKHQYLIANIPNAKRSLIIENLNVDNSKVKRTQKIILPSQIDIEEVLIKKGKNTIRSIVKYEFNDKVTPVFTDTISFDVNVN